MIWTSPNWDNCGYWYLYDMYFYSEENKVKSFILLMWFSFTFEKQKLLLREGSKVPINTFEQTVRLSGNATCVLQFLICELAALTCPMLTSSLNLKTQTWWRMLQKLKSLKFWIQKWCPSLIVWKMLSAIGWKCKKKDCKKTHNLVSSSTVSTAGFLSQFFAYRSMKVLCIFLQWPWKY